VSRTKDDFGIMEKLLCANLHTPVATLAKIKHLNPRSMFIKN